jgi:heptosyltransferase-2
VRELGNAGRRPVLALHPGAGAVEKRAPRAALAELCLRWRRDGGGPIAVILGPAERNEVERWSELGEVVLPEDVADLAAAIAQAAAFVGNDSGPSHVAAALGVRTVALHVRDEPGAFVPRGKRVAIVSLPAAAAIADALQAAWLGVRGALP